MKTIQTTVYTFDELSDSAKEKVRNWWREGGLDYDWWQCVYDDAERIGLKLTSFDLDHNWHATGHFINDATDCAQAIIREHGDTCDTYKTAKSFLMSMDSLLDEYGGDIDGQSNIDGSNNYEEEKEELEGEFLKSILEDYSIMLQKEYEYLTSDDHVDEVILINEYTFTKDGKRFG